MHGSIPLKKMTPQPNPHAKCISYMTTVYCERAAASSCLQKFKCGAKKLNLAHERGQEEEVESFFVLMQFQAW